MYVSKLVPTSHRFCEFQPPSLKPKVNPVDAMFDAAKLSAPKGTSLREKHEAARLAASAKEAKAMESAPRAGLDQLEDIFAAVMPATTNSSSSAGSFSQPNSHPSSNIPDDEWTGFSNATDSDKDKDKDNAAVVSAPVQQPQQYSQPMPMQQQQQQYQGQFSSSNYHQSVPMQQQQYDGQLSHNQSVSIPMQQQQQQYHGQFSSNQSVSAPMQQQVGAVPVDLQTEVSGEDDFQFQSAKSDAGFPSDESDIFEGFTAATGGQPSVPIGVESHTHQLGSFTMPAAPVQNRGPTVAPTATVPVPSSMVPSSVVSHDKYAVFSHLESQEISTANSQEASQASESLPPDNAAAGEGDAGEFEFHSAGNTVCAEGDVFSEFQADDTDTPSIGSARVPSAAPSGMVAPALSAGSDKYDVFLSVMECDSQPVTANANSNVPAEDPCMQGGEVQVEDLPGTEEAEFQAAQPGDNDSHDQTFAAFEIPSSSSSSSSSSTIPPNQAVDTEKKLTPIDRYAVFGVMDLPEPPSTAPTTSLAVAIGRDGEPTQMMPNDFDGFVHATEEVPSDFDGFSAFVGPEGADSIADPTDQDDSDHQDELPPLSLASHVSLEAIHSDAAPTTTLPRPVVEGPPALFADLLSSTSTSNSGSTSTSTVGAMAGIPTIGVDNHGAVDGMAAFSVASASSAVSAASVISNPEDPSTAITQTASLPDECLYASLRASVDILGAGCDLIKQLYKKGGIAALRDGRCLLYAGDLRAVAGLSCRLAVQGENLPPHRRQVMEAVLMERCEKAESLWETVRWADASVVTELLGADQPPSPPAVVATPHPSETETHSPRMAPAAAPVSVCGICQESIVPSGTGPETPVTWWNDTYHAQCANFWANEICTTPPLHVQPTDLPDYYRLPPQSRLDL